MVGVLSFISAKKIDVLGKLKFSTFILIFVMKSQEVEVLPNYILIMKTIFCCS